MPAIDPHRNMGDHFLQGLSLNPDRLIITKAIDMKISGAMKAVNNFTKTDSAINTAESAKGCHWFDSNQRMKKNTEKEASEIAGRPIMIAVERCVYHGRMKKRGKTNMDAQGLVVTDTMAPILNTLIAEKMRTRSLAATVEFRLN